MYIFPYLQVMVGFIVLQQMDGDNLPTYQRAGLGKKKERKKEQHLLKLLIILKQLYVALSQNIFL